MKLIYLSIAALGFTSLVNAQDVTVQTPVLLETQEISKTPAGERTPTDTLGLTDGTFAPNGQVTSYGNQGGGWIYGVNTVNVGAAPYGIGATAQGYIWQGTAGVEEALVWYTAKEGVSGDASAFIVCNVFSMVDGGATGGDLGTGGTPTMGPGEVLGSQTQLFDDADTNFLAFNVFTFDEVIGVNGDFAISMNFENLYSTGDTIGLVSDQVGDAYGLDYVFSKLRVNNNWYVTNSLYGGQLDNNVAIFAVLDANSVGIDSEDFFYGMKLDAPAPNPAVNSTTIKYSLDKAADVTLTVFDINGKKIKEISVEQQAQGVHSFELETAEFAAGTYYYSLSNGENRITKKLVVIK